jgi:hypothetical protein
VTSVKKRTLSLAQLNLELAKLEGKQKAAELGIGAGLGAVAAVLIVYGIEDPVPRSRDRRVPRNAVRAQGLASDAVASDRRSLPHPSDVRGPCLRSPASTRSAGKSPPSGSASTTI